MSLGDSIQFDAQQILTCLHHYTRSLKLHHSECTSALDDINKSSNEFEENINRTASEMIQFITQLRTSTLDSLARLSRDLRDSVQKRSEILTEYQRRIKGCEKKLAKCGPRQDLEEAKNLLIEIDETIGKIYHGDFKPRIEFLQSKEVTKFLKECTDLGKMSVVYNQSNQNEFRETKENVYIPSGSDISYVGVSGNMDPELASITTDGSAYATVDGLDTIIRGMTSITNDSTLYSETEMTRDVARSMRLYDNHSHRQRETADFLLLNTMQVPLICENYCEITSLIVLENGDIVLTDYANCCLTVYRREDSYHIQLDDRPCSVCRSDIDDSIIVGLCTKALLIRYAMKGGCLQEMQRISIKTEGDLVCVCCDAGTILLSCAGKEIKKLSSRTSRVLKTIKLNDTGTLSLHCVSSIATDGLSIYGGDKGKVVCMDINNGALKWIYAPQNFDPGDIKLKDELLYVADWEGHSVKILCKYCGVLVKDVVIGVDIYHPRAIYIDTSRNCLFLSQYDEKSSDKNNQILQFDMCTQQQCGPCECTRKQSTRP